jgi:hypothetical protein
METFDGYKAGSTPGATVVGINQAAMANRPTFGLVEAANQQWALGSIPQIPLAAAIYVPPGSNIKPNVSTPNSLPANASMGVFLAPQANVPITGDIWGLQFKLSCIGVERLDQFTILNRRVNSSNPEYATSEMIGEKDIHFYYRLDDGSTISVLSSFALITDSLAYVEIGSRYETLVDNPDRWGYSCGGGSCTGDPMDLTYAGMDEEEVFEYVLWQAFQPVPGQIPKKPQPRQYPIPELENERRPVNDTLLRTPWTEPVQAIGVRCTSSSAMGTAKVNGFSGHFEDFRREDPPVGRSLATNIPRLSNGIPLMFLPANEENWASFLNYGAEFPTDLLGNISGTIQYVTFNDTPADWLARLAVAAHQKRNTSTTAQHLLYYDNLIQTQGLLDAIVSAYHHYAVQIMFLNDNTPTDYWTHYGITASVPWSLLRASSNGVAPLFVVIVMMIWAVACSGLSLAFGFRRRLASTCDYAYIQEYQQTFPEAITTVEVQRQETIARKL